MNRWAIEVSGVSEIGLRKPDNQDRIIARVGENHTGDFGLFAVADGVGGHQGGGLAADIVIECLNMWWQRILPKIFDPSPAETMNRWVAALEQVLYRGHEEIQLQTGPLGIRPATTASVLAVYGGWMGLLHIGDSRIYQTYPRFLQHTQDDTWIAQKCYAGLLSGHEAKNHPMGHILSRSMGIPENFVISRQLMPLGAKTHFLLCTDGFYQYLTPEDLCGITGQQNLQGLLAEALQKIYRQGAADNCSAVALRVSERSSHGV